MDQDEAMWRMRSREPNLTAEYRPNSENHKRRFKVSGTQGKRINVKFEEAYKAKELSKYQLFAKKAHLVAKADSKRGLDLSLELTHRYSQAFEVHVSSLSFDNRNRLLYLQC